jgi:(R)-2-hydroxyacyl-CoA dehydratese activating ATPase
MIVLGSDVGSLFTKVVILVDDEPKGHAIARTTGTIGDEIDALIAKACTESGISSDQIDRIIATGSGADLITHADAVEEELTCIGAAGAFFLEKIDSVIEIGGQSISSVSLDLDGDVINFSRNDKCASGSGRFIEMMGEKLNVPIEGIDAEAAKATQPVPLSSQCGVFAESEVITHVNAGRARPDILAGVCQSVARIVTSQARRMRTDQYTVTGGVARLGTVVGYINDGLDGVYHPFPFNPALACAIGAALLGVEGP